MRALDHQRGTEPDYQPGTESADTGPIERELLEFLSDRTRTRFAPDQDLFATGGISSLFAMELVLFLEQQFGVSLTGPLLKLDNFRTVRAMAALVRQLTGGQLR